MRPREGSSEDTSHRGVELKIASGGWEGNRTQPGPLGLVLMSGGTRARLISRVWRGRSMLF